MCRSIAKALRWHVNFLFSGHTDKSCSVERSRPLLFPYFVDVLQLLFFGRRCLLDLTVNRFIDIFISVSDPLRQLLIIQRQDYLLLTRLLMKIGFAGGNEDDRMYVDWTLAWPSSVPEVGAQLSERRDTHCILYSVKYVQGNSRARKVSPGLDEPPSFRYGGPKRNERDALCRLQ